MISLTSSPSGACTIRSGCACPSWLCGSLIVAGPFRCVVIRRQPPLPQAYVAGTIVALHDFRHMRMNVAAYL